MTTTVVPVPLTGVRKAAIAHAAARRGVARPGLQVPQRGRDRADRPRGRGDGQRPRAVGRAGARRVQQHVAGRGVRRRGGIDYAQKLLVKSLGHRHGQAGCSIAWCKSFESDGRLHRAREGRPAAALEVHPGRAPADDRADPRAPEAGQRRAAGRRCCPTTLRADVLTRMASLDEISPEVITPHLVGDRAAAEDARRPQPRAARRRPRRRGAASTGSIAASASRCSKRSRRDAPDLAVSIRNLMFVFDDCRTSTTTASARSSSAPTRRC